MAPFTWVGLVAAAPRIPPALLWPAFLLVLVGFGTKVGLVPMQLGSRMLIAKRRHRSAPSSPA